MTRNHVDFVEFKNHMNPKKYMTNIRMARSSDKKHLTEKFKARLIREELYQNTFLNGQRAIIRKNWPWFSSYLKPQICLKMS